MPRPHARPGRADPAAGQHDGSRHDRLVGQVGDRPSDAQDPVDAACRPAGRLGQVGQDAPGVGPERSGIGHLATRELPVQASTVARPGPRPGRCDAAGDGTGGLGWLLRDELTWLDTAHLDAQIETIEERTADAPDVALGLPWRTGAASLWVAVEAAAAGVHGRDDLDPSRIAHVPACPDDGDFTLLERLAQGVEHVPVELRELVEEERAPVRERDLAGCQPRSATDERRVAGRVVRGTERGGADQARRATRGVRPRCR